MAVTLGNLNGSLSMAIGCVQCSLSTWTLQEQAGDALKSIPGSKVEEWWCICMVELWCWESNVSRLTVLTSPIRPRNEHLYTHYSLTAKVSPLLLLPLQVITWSWPDVSNLTQSGESKKDSLEALIDLFVMETFPCALFSRVKDQSQELMKPSICHIMSQEIMEWLSFHGR